MVVPLLVGAARVAKSTKRARQSPASLVSSKKPHKHPTNRNKRRHVENTQRDRRARPQTQSNQIVSESKTQIKLKKKHTKEKVHVITDGIIAAGNSSYYMVLQIIFFMFAVSAFTMEDKWYGFLIPAETAGGILYTLSIFFSVIGISIAAIAMKRFLKKMHILILFFICFSGAVALPVVPWAGVWILATVYSILSKK